LLIKLIRTITNGYLVLAQPYFNKLSLSTFLGFSELIDTMYDAESTVINKKKLGPYFNICFQQATYKPLTKLGMLFSLDGDCLSVFQLRPVNKTINEGG
jgi:hypothetical protein